MVAWGFQNCKYSVAFDVSSRRNAVLSFNGQRMSLAVRGGLSLVGCAWFWTRGLVMHSPG